MDLTTSEQLRLYEICILDGLSISYGKLSLCDLRNRYHSNVFRNRKYQVHSDDSSYPHSAIYEELPSAVRKFADIKTRIKNKS